MSIRIAPFFMRSVFAALPLFLAGCTIATLAKLPTPRPDERGTDTVYISLTHATLDPARRAAFDDYTRRLARELPNAPGLITHSLRRQLFGNEVWTMTVWATAEDRTRFVQSPLHRAAIAEAAPALLNIRFKRAELRRDALPLSWGNALVLIEQQSTTYSSAKP